MQGIQGAGNPNNITSLFLGHFEIFAFVMFILTVQANWNETSNESTSHGFVQSNCETNSSKTMDENELKRKHSPIGRKILRVVVNPNTWFAVIKGKQGQWESKEYTY